MTAIRDRDLALPSQMCRRYPGFLRAAIADPQPERRWFRRGWVTFERQVNIKEICWNLNNIRVSLLQLRREIGTGTGDWDRHGAVIEKYAIKYAICMDQRHKI